MAPGKLWHEHFANTLANRLSKIYQNLFKILSKITKPLEVTREFSFSSLKDYI